MCYCVLRLQTVSGQKSKGITMNTPSIVKFQGGYYIAQFVEGYAACVCLDTTFTQITLDITKVTHIKNLPWKMFRGYKFAKLPSGRILNVTTGKLVEAKDAPPFGAGDGTHNPARYTDATLAERNTQRADRTLRVSEAKAKSEVTAHLNAPAPVEVLVPYKPAKAATALKFPCLVEALGRKHYAYGLNKDGSVKLFGWTDGALGKVKLTVYPKDLKIIALKGKIQVHDVRGVSFFQLPVVSENRNVVVSMATGNVITDKKIVGLFSTAVVNIY